ncbi:kynureninase [Nocardioides bruguierae]|uniref:kynureninase n=1 Tax=Nocardioides bruguierae TaxID=2945102 RepID=UPI0020222645|nr:aminotransferase class V-fold PLP-dependent enzyme [Nocardioides bruguierae]MCL8026526.1 aminotransferase class V-fold PLP-dependent enzyme [Nocardioides bruguierae]
MSTSPDLVPAHALDAADPLAAHRDRFVGAEQPLVYLDGNSLGRPLRVTGERLRSFVDEEWGGRLIRGWGDVGEGGWMDLPLTLGDRIARTCLGAAPGQVVVGDSTTVNLYKLLHAAAALRPGRTEVVLSADDFPTDRYVAESVARERGLHLVWIEPAEPTTGVTDDEVAAVVGEQTAVVLLSHVAYRSAAIAPLAAVAEVAHEVGALVLADLSHSVGVLPVQLDRTGVDLAVGCTYKFLNGGPGAPALAYVAARHHAGLAQPVTGWMGHTDPFAMGPGYEPAPGVRRLVAGTPSVLSMQPVADMLDLLDEVGIEAVRAKSVALTTFAADAGRRLLPDARLGSPADPERRGGHVTLLHPRMREVVAGLWQREVLPDYRDPGGLRLGLSPLSTSFAEVEAGISAAAEVLAGLA